MAAVVESRIPLLDEILGDHILELGRDHVGYRNHVYRVVNFSFALSDPDDAEREKIIIAACFHDLGIWTGGGFDYLPPSIAHAGRYLNETRRESWVPEIEMMIDQHHRLRRSTDGSYPLVETFRRADLVDLTLGIRKCGLPRKFISAVKYRFPNAGFHKRLVRLAGGWFCRHPLNPLPVV